MTEGNTDRNRSSIQPETDPEKKKKKRTIRKIKRMRQDSK